MNTILISQKNSVVKIMLPTLFLTFVFCYTSFGNFESAKPLPESEYIEFLNKAAALAKANYEKIKTWQGEIGVEEDNYYYGAACQSLAPNEESENIRRRASLIEKFAVDVKNNKLYCAKSMPQIRYNAIDLKKDITLKSKPKFTSVISVVTADEYLSFMPDLNYGYSTKINGKWAGKMAVRLPIEKFKEDQWGYIRDPRKYFSEGHRMTWEDIEVLSNYLANPSPDIPPGKAPQISISTEGSNTHIKTRFYSSLECESCKNEFVNINMILDSSVEYNLIHREALDEKNEPLLTLDISYEKIDNIYVPKTIHLILFHPSDLKKSFDSKITFTKSILNAPIPSDTFTYKHLGLNENDVFRDEIQKKEYKYRDGNLIFVKNLDKKGKDD
jgi:hypothetical protein